MGQIITNYGETKMWCVFKVSRRGAFSHYFLLQSSVSFGSFITKLTLEEATNPDGE
jgi:hypothetical protein